MPEVRLWGHPIKENAIVSSGGKEIPLFLQTWQTILCKPRRVYEQPVYLSAIRLKDGFLIIASNAQGQAALDAYKKRWGIEVLFANLKSRGFDLEETHLVHEERIEKTSAAVTAEVRIAGTSGTILWFLL